MRLLVTGGGTGGHVYPALSVIEALLQDAEWAMNSGDVSWVGSADSIEERVLKKEGLTFYSIATGALRGVNPLTVLRGLGALARGALEARKLMDQLRPDVVLATGGFVSVPLVLAARMVGCPVLIYLPDMEPGLAVKFTSFFAQRVAVSFESVGRHFPDDKVLISGYPVRQALHVSDKSQARDALDLVDDPPVLLILGGSRGAHSLNETVRQNLESLLHVAQVVHISGFDDHGELNRVRDSLDSDLFSRYHLYAYMYDQMTDALMAADLVVARAGAATLGEFPAVGLPAILVPYPYSGQHQYVNARCLVEQGAAIIVEDSALDTSLLPAVEGLLHCPQRLQDMSIASRKLAKPDAARVIAGELFSLVEGPSRGEGKRHG